jgi:hypothetical protein
MYVSLTRLITNESSINFLFMKLVGPPLSKFDPNAHVKTWPLSGSRRAEETACRKKVEVEEEKLNTFYRGTSYRLSRQGSRFLH